MAREAASWGLNSRRARVPGGASASARVRRNGSRNVVRIQDLLMEASRMGRSWWSSVVKCAPVRWGSGPPRFAP
jgi:hypothetical protein